MSLAEIPARQEELCIVAVPALPQLIHKPSLHQSRQSFLQTEAANTLAPLSRFETSSKTGQSELAFQKHGPQQGAVQLLPAACGTKYEIMRFMAQTQANTSEIYTKNVKKSRIGKACD
ncbi:hypothetical protein [Sulfitobacter guttiformis]|uniref:hypothetical protein n=1 Tax=Sulfitobacter guttiformis TaxID=74349 RepID=UPI0011C40634|nr:hypothetical protein [Sulfitobacter guttiformis]